MSDLNEGATVAVVGGGTAGWLTAAFLARSAELNGERFSIQVIEAPQIDAIGVGEATIPGIQGILRFLGIPETVFMKETAATFKQAIKFIGWTDAAGGPPNQSNAFYHPFEDFRRWDTFDPIDHWISSPEARAKSTLVDSVIIQGRLCEAGFAPKPSNAPDYQAGISYAYHLDATRFATLLRSYSESRGVGFVEGRVSGVTRGEDGQITALRLEGGTSIAVDLVVDCTGFEALLIEKEMGAEFTECGERLLCDSAVALPVEHPQRLHRIDPFTKATAQDHGWIWDIPLWSRRGTGYVYSSAFEDKDSAARRLAEYSGLKNLDDLPFRHIPLRVGYRQEQWIGNCVAVGLSAGFLEPLESTGIYLIERAVRALGELYVGKRTDLNAAARQYNQLLGDEFAVVADFIQLHYVLAHRRDTAFWKENTLSPKLSDRLASQLTQWRYRRPLDFDALNRDTAFGPSNFMAILYGMGALPEGRPLPQAAQDQAEKYRRELDQAVLSAKANLESHYSSLSRINSD